MAERYAGKGAPPAHGLRDPANRGGDYITQGLPQGEAFHRVTPYAVDAVGTVRFAQHLLEVDLL